MSLLDKFEHELQKIVVEEIEREKNALGNAAAFDYPDYKYRTGKLAGFAALSSFIDEARRATLNH